MHQARAALDNLVGALREGGPTSRSAYPVVLTDPDFEATVGDSLKGVPDWAIQVIRRVQPFSDDPSQAYGGKQLRLLHDMARLDRHRAPHLHASLVQIDHVEGYSVQFTDGPLAGFEVAGATRSLIGIAEWTIGLIRQAEWRHAQLNP
jgi:hypothetical protein